MTLFKQQGQFCGAVANTHVLWASVNVLVVLVLSRSSETKMRWKKCWRNEEQLRGAAEEAGGESVEASWSFTRGRA